MGNPIELAKKLKALADQGVGGEKVNASKMLQDLMEKHSISWGELEDAQIKEYKFKVPQKSATLFSQIVWCISGLTFSKTKANIKTIQYIDVTADQAIEISAKFEFYSKLLEEEYELLYVAFFHKHKIFNETPIKGKSDKKIDFNELRRLESMIASLKDQSFAKRIGNPDSI